LNRVHRRLEFRRLRLGAALLSPLSSWAAHAVAWRRHSWRHSHRLRRGDRLELPEPAAAVVVIKDVVARCMAEAASLRPGFEWIQQCSTLQLRCCGIRHLAASIRSGQYRLASSIASDTTNRSNSSSRNERMSSSHKKFTVSVEGNIGSGKSTMLEYFSSGIVESIPEPIDKWCNLAGICTGLSAHRPVKMLERSVYTARFCFMTNAVNQGLLNSAEMQVLDCYYRSLLTGQWAEHLRVDLYVYLRCPPEICFNRVKLRNRSEESAGVTLSLLENLHQLHEQWLLDDQSADRPNAPTKRTPRATYTSPASIVIVIIFSEHILNPRCRSRGWQSWRDSFAFIQSGRTGAR
uniref:DNK domain-containing protein n=1 Tax=Macrostomum lignano TaxID=282301 RepID=A0A1I8I1Y8_9PLAT